MLDNNSQKVRISIKYLILNALACITIITIYVTNKETKDEDVATDFEMYYWQSALLSNNLSCVYDDKGDALPSMKDFSPPEKSIYFHETSCRNGLNSREACAVESAARSHPNWQIHMIFSSTITSDALNTGSLAALKSFKNIKLIRMNINNLGPYKALADKIIEQSVYPIEQLSQLVRFVTLNTWGGIYMDLDIIVVKSFDSLPSNWVARDADDSVGSAILAFSKDNMGRNFSETILKEINNTFKPSDWSYNGSAAITNVFRNKCSARKPIYWSATTCQDFNVFDPPLFYPVLDFQSKAYIRDGHLRAAGVFTHHMWNHKTKGELVQKNSPYAKLARRFCPSIYKIFGETFGTDGV